MTYGSNADTRYAEWQAAQDRDPDEPTWQQIKADKARGEREHRAWMRSRRVERDEQGRVCGDPWAL